MSLRRSFTVGALAFPLLAASLASATVYGLKSTAPAAPNVSGPPVRLFSFSENGTGFTDIATVTLDGVPIDVDGLAFGPSGDLLAFDIHPDGSRLLRLDRTSGAASVIGPRLATREMRGAALEPSGNVLALDYSASELVRVNPFTGEQVGSGLPLRFGIRPLFVSDGCDLAYAADGRLFVTDLGAIFECNPLTGALVTRANVTPNIFAGAACSIDGPSTQMFLYEVNAADDIFTYTLGEATAAPFIANIIPSFNAGRGDLAAELTRPCRADFNADGRIDPDDLADFITGYFSLPPDPRTDFNGDGSIDPDDLADFITLYFGGC